MHIIQIYVILQKDIPSRFVYKGDKSKRWKRWPLFLRRIYRSGFEDAQQCYLGDEYAAKHLTDHTRFDLINLRVGARLCVRTSVRPNERPSPISRTYAHVHESETVDCLLNFCMVFLFDRCRTGLPPRISPPPQPRLTPTTLGNPQASLSGFITFSLYVL